MPEDVHATMIDNAPTIPGEVTDPETSSIDAEVLARYQEAALVTSGEQSPPLYTSVVTRLAELLPQAEHVVLRGGSHIPHVTHPDVYVQEVVAFTAPGRHDATSGSSAGDGRR